MTGPATGRVVYQAGETGRRPWGGWEVLGTGGNFAVKRIEVLPGQRLSLQYHNRRAEHWVIVAGTGEVTRDHERIRVGSGACVHIPVGAAHRIHNTGDAPLVFVEVQLGDLLDENDIVRIEDDYDRA